MIALAAAAALSLSTSLSSSGAPTFTPESVRAHVGFLSDDLLEGRDTGSRGHRIAAHYVAAQFEALGLKPAGDAGSWFQEIAFQQTNRTAKPGTVTVSGPAGEKSWNHDTEVLIGLNPLEPSHGASLNGPAAEAVFAGAPRSLAAIRKAADKAGAKPKGFALKTSMRIRIEATTKRVTSPNVAAILPGSDPSLAAEHVVLSAHLDHIGLAQAKESDGPTTDRINNGTLDNAAGVAMLLEVARAAAHAPIRPRRSLLFLATTAEEMGLLGADYFARHPSVPIGKIVGTVDLDMPVLLYRFTDVIAYGAEHSTIGPMAAAAIAPMGITLSPDPTPEQGIFVRSDHYMFVRQGVPAIYLATGYASGGEKATEEFVNGNYHHPGDDMSQKIDWVAGARFAEANYRITRAMADADAPPLWFEANFFGDALAPDRPKAARATTKRSPPRGK